MASQDPSAIVRVATFPRMRVLTWHDDSLYAARGYSLLRASVNADAIDWQPVARYNPRWWRNLTAASRLTFRLFRDGFHALAVLGSGHLIAAVPGAILTLAPGETEFRETHHVQRGTRPLHITCTPNDRVFWGEYFDNPSREEVYIYGSDDHGATWEVVYTFPRGAVRHVHNIVYDAWDNCLWILTGDHGAECRILRASIDFRSVTEVLSGHQQARAVALVPRSDGLYFSSDTPLEANHVYRLDRRGSLTELKPLSSSSIYGCQVRDRIFFSTMVEPSRMNLTSKLQLYGSAGGTSWHSLMQWRKDFWPMSLFQYGNVILPDGHNSTEFLALTTVAVRHHDLETSIWRVP